MEGEAAYCLGLAYHSAGEEQTAILVSLLKILQLFPLSFFASLTFFLEAMYKYAFLEVGNFYLLLVLSRDQRLLSLEKV